MLIVLSNCSWAGIADADVVAEALAHAALAVEAAQDRQRQADLRLLAGVLLQAGGPSSG